MARRYIRIPTMKEKLGGCSDSTVWRRVADGTLPPPRKLGGMRVWDEDEVDERVGLAEPSEEEVA